MSHRIPDEDIDAYFYDGSTKGWEKNPWNSRAVTSWENQSGGRPAMTVTTDDEESDDNKDDEEGNPKSLKRVFVRFAERTSMQGVPYINASKVWPARLAWSIFLTGALVVMSLHLWLLFTTFLQWPKFSVINLGYNQLRFPAITLCNVNPIRKSQMHLANQALTDFVQKVEPSNIVNMLQQHRPPPPPPQSRESTDTQPGTNTGTQNSGSLGTSGSSQTSQGGSQTSQGGSQTSQGGSQTNQGGSQTNQGGSQTNQGGSQTSQGGSQTSQGGSQTNQGGSQTSQGGSQTNQGGSQTSQSGSQTSGRRRRKRFLEGISINFTNTGQGEASHTRDQVASRNQMYTGEKSTIREMTEEFKYLFNAHNRSTRMEMGHTIDDMILACSFSGRVCNSSLFVLHTSSTYGNCYTLEKKNFVSSSGGPDDGLELLLFMQNDEYLQGVAKGLGMVLVIHPQNTWAFPDEQASFIPSSMETRIGIRKVHIERLGSPWGECVSEDSYSSYGITYTRQVCQAWCQQQQTLTECNCFDEGKEELLRTFSMETRKPCRTANETTCLARVQGEFISGTLKCDCTNPCNEETFKESTSQRQWPSKEYASVLLEQVCALVNESTCLTYTNMDMRDFSEYFVKLTIYYQDLNYENITEEIGYEIQQFISDVGGTVGLWVGLSMLSTVEIVQLLMELVHYVFYVRPRQARKKRQRKTKAKTRAKDGPILKDSPPKTTAGGTKLVANGVKFGVPRNPAAQQPYFRPTRNYY